MFYPPVAICYLWLAIKYRGAMLPTAANPGIFSGGMVGESKMATLRDLMTHSPEFTADAELILGSTVEERLASLQDIRARREIGARARVPRAPCAAGTRRAHGAGPPPSRW